MFYSNNLDECEISKVNIYPIFKKLNNQNLSRMALFFVQKW